MANPRPPRREGKFPPRPDRPGPGPRRPGGPGPRPGRPENSGGPRHAGSPGPRPDRPGARPEHSAGPRRPGGPPPRPPRPGGAPNRPGGPPPRPPRPGGPPPGVEGRPGPRMDARSRGGSTESGEPERLQKLLAHAGLGSRRSCEELIIQGRVTVDREVVRELGTRVDLNRSVVAVDGQKIKLEPHVYFAVCKPKGYVSTNADPAGRPRVIDILPDIPERVYTVGRLDEMSVGLLLLTNDGELANKLSHPKFGVEKLYRVMVAGTPSTDALKQLTDGVWLAEGKVRAKRVAIVAKRGMSTVLEMVLAEGKNREVRRMLARLGHKVMVLTRVAVGPITLKGLLPGQYRSLSTHEVDLLRRAAAGLPVPMPRFANRKHDVPVRRGPARTNVAPDTSRRPSGPGGPPPRRQGPGPGVRPGDDDRIPMRGLPVARRTGPITSPPPGLPPSRRPPSPGGPPPRRQYEPDDRRPGPVSGGPPRRGPYQGQDRDQGPSGPPRRGPYQGQDRDQGSAGPPRRGPYQGQDRDQGSARPPRRGPYQGQGQHQPRPPRTGGPAPRDGYQGQGRSGPPPSGGPQGTQRRPPQAGMRDAGGTRPGGPPPSRSRPPGPPARPPAPPRPAKVEPQQRRVIGMGGDDGRPESPGPRLRRPDVKKKAPNPLIISKRPKRKGGPAGPSGD